MYVLAGVFLWREGMTDLEISKALAYVIGWRAPHMSQDGDKLRCWRDERQWGWQVFDYRDWRVIGPIAERYEAFPMHFNRGGSHWLSCAILGDYMGEAKADTPQKAIALAVIGAKQ